MRKPIFMILALLIMAINFLSCKKIYGDGPTVTETRTITGFNAVYAAIDGDVYITQGNPYKVEIQAQQNILEVIESPTINGELRIQFKNNVRIGDHDRIKVFITAPVISGLSINGSGTLNAHQQVNADFIKLNVNGSGSMSLSALTANTINSKISGSGDIIVYNGNTDNESIEISGSGSADMFGLTAKTSDVHISGSGTIKVNVSNTLDVSISGSGDVYYTGTANVSTHISGSGTVTRL